MRKIDLKGTWGFCLDKDKIGIEKKYYTADFEDTIELPATVSTARKGFPSEEKHTGYLTDPYLFEGYTWYSKTIEILDTKSNRQLDTDKSIVQYITTDISDKEFILNLERTRISHVWVNDIYIGSNNSLNGSHQYCITNYLNLSESKQNRITIMVDNTSYPVKGGHMTSPDTQTNWNGITGDISIGIHNKVYLSEVKIFPDASKKQIKVKVLLHNADQNGNLGLTAVVSSINAEEQYQKSEYLLQEGENTFTYYLDESAKSWSEHTPILYNLHLELKQEDNLLEEYDYSFGLRDFKAVGNYFEINGNRTFLRGKHDGLIFPMTGHAPTDVDSWLQVLRIAKDYGINHYRFHTCCPPNAAFIAADQLGIYMQPELPFWGTVTIEGEENHDEQAQKYLIEEGFRILDEYGNHPSFVMMSLGNELWGSKERLNQILGDYKAYDSRHLYTGGSNNFQFMPCILENEDFFSGVRFSRDRLFRGSYAMCDAPQGHIQTKAPNMNYNYDAMIRPNRLLEETKAGGEVTIQYGTGTKTVKVDASNELIPVVPVVSHEIGQYAMYPDFTEIDKYTGVLKARNLEVFRERLEEKGMILMAEHFFKASGRFAAECYKAEFETALRSNELAGFQVLDLQDFTGQGTALIGILNSFMENKGLIAAEEWRQFCSDAVVLLELPKMIFQALESVNLNVKLAIYQPEVMVSPEVKLIISECSKSENRNIYDNNILLEKKLIAQGEYSYGVYDIGEFDIKLPAAINPMKLKLEVSVEGTSITNSYDIWLYPEVNSVSLEDSNIVIEDSNIVITDDITEAQKRLNEGKKVLFYPKNLTDTNSIEGTYCTDFWCYPMFRSISESMGRPVPIGTHGLYIDKEHSVFNNFPTEFYSTAPWYDIVSNSRALILDELKTNLEPVVWTIDNFERNHKLGNIIECRVGEGKLLVCTCDLRRLKESEPAKWLEYSILKYIDSEEFNPKVEVSMEELNDIFKEISVN